MQTSLTEELLTSRVGKEADSILRSCVHCGFCTATCPTYQLTGNELDGPRGRIYLMKQVMEGQPVTAKTQYHLDRCLTCRSCETTCPSGVRYGRLVDIGRELVEHSVGRSTISSWQRWLLRKILPYPEYFGVLLGLGRTFKFLMPSAIKSKVPDKQLDSGRIVSDHQRRMLIMEGCAQSVATPETNNAAARVLDKLGISLVSVAKQGCCGAVSQHLAADEEAKTFVRNNIDAWWPEIEKGAEAIIVSASGCSVMVKDYAHLMQDDPDYADKASKISELSKDLSEVIAQEDLAPLVKPKAGRVAFHSPCTLQHGLKQGGVVESILEKVGYSVFLPEDKHLCCGSAGTYSILQPEMSQHLLANKIANLTADENTRPIITANVGCQLHLQSKADVPVLHWIELLDQ